MDPVTALKYGLIDEIVGAAQEENDSDSAESTDAE
jgi:ATP-dependent protease ClpP protease subunit